MILASLAALLLQAAPAAAPPSTVDPVVVQADRATLERQRQAVESFVGSLSEPTRRGRLARWRGGVCTGVVGLPQRYGGYVADRVAAEALAVDLGVEGPGCRPNILILFTPEPDRAAAAFAERYRYFLSPGQRTDSAYAGGGEQVVADFILAARPVRWWHVAEMHQTDGRALNWVRLQGPAGPMTPAVVGPEGGRLASRWKEDLARALIIVDTRQLKGVTWEALAGYLSLVTLAQLDPAADPGMLPSALTLFADRDAGRPTPEGLTDYDRAYLRGLYAAPVNARNLNSQKGAIRREMRRELQRAAQRPPSP